MSEVLFRFYPAAHVTGFYVLEIPQRADAVQRSAKAFRFFVC